MKKVVMGITISMALLGMEDVLTAAGPTETPKREAPAIIKESNKSIKRAVSAPQEAKDELTKGRIPQPIKIGKRPSPDGEPKKPKKPKKQKY